LVARPPLPVESYRRAATTFYQSASSVRLASGATRWPIGRQNLGCAASTARAPGRSRWPGRPEGHTLRGREGTGCA